MTFISYQPLPLSLYTELSNKPMQPSFLYISNSNTNFVNFSTHENQNISTLLFLVDLSSPSSLSTNAETQGTSSPNANRAFPNITSSTEDERFIPTIKKVRWHCIVGLFCCVKPIWRPVFQLLPQCREWRIIHNKPLCFSDLNSNSHHMEWRWVSGLLITLILC